MSGARETITVYSNTSEPNCDGCPLANDIGGREGFVNPDCAGNRAARVEIGLSIEACGLVLMQYAVDSENHQIFNGSAITSSHTRTLKKIFVEPVGGRWQLLTEDYETRGHSELIIDLEQ